MPDENVVLFNFNSFYFITSIVNSILGLGLGTNWAVQKALLGVLYRAAFTAFKNCATPKRSNA